MKCGNCKTQLPVEYVSGYCSVKCGRLARATVEARTAAAIADWLEAKGDSCNPIVSAEQIRSGAWKGERRCPHCRRCFRLVRGKFPQHTADCDGPGYPYDCPWSKRAALGGAP